MKKVIFHVIESLGLGGAEMLLLNTINALGSQFSNTVVYLNGPETLAEKFSNTTLICLGYQGKKSLPATILKLRRLIISNKADIVHAHLLWSSIIARLACPSNVKLLFSVHSVLSQDAFGRNPYIGLLEKFTYRGRHEAIFVSDMVRQDYAATIGLKGKSHVLYNFISDKFFITPPSTRGYMSQPIRLVSIGNLKEAKNYPFLIKAMQALKDQEIILDIYGEGHLKTQLQELINEAGLSKVNLKGLAFDVPELLKNYDIFVLPSKYEGFGLAAIEGMASGLPCFLSDLPVFREITAGNAIFFSLSDESDFAGKLQNALQDKKALQALALAGWEQAKKFKRESYISQLREIYEND